MSLLSNLTARLSLGKKEENPENFFALNIGPQNLTTALWTIEHNQLKVVNSSSSEYSSTEDIIPVTDKLLGEVLGEISPEPEKILFGVPDSWLQDEDLKEPYMKLLKNLVKELEVTPMAYVATSHALSHFIEKQTGTPATAILVGLDEKYSTVTVVRAGKLDGSKITPRGDNLGADIEKLLLNFTSVEVLPSKIILYGDDHQGLDKHKNQLLEYSWMSKLSFLHFPKIEALDDSVEIESVAFAGAVELNSAVEFKKSTTKAVLTKTLVTDTTDSDKDKKTKGEGDDNFKPMSEEEIEKQLKELNEAKEDDKKGLKEEKNENDKKDKESSSSLEDKKQEKIPAEELGFVAGDIADKKTRGDNFSFADEDLIPESNDLALASEKDLTSGTPAYEIPAKKDEEGLKNNLGILSLVKFKEFFKGRRVILAALFVILLVFLGGYLFLAQADVKIFVEPQILEKDAQIVADPKISEVNEEENKIPGESVSVQVSGSGKGAATGTKLVGDPAKGVAIIYNKTNSQVSLNKGAVLTGPGGVKFTLDISTKIASQSSTTDSNQNTIISPGRESVEITASTIGADGNIPSQTNLSVSGYESSQVFAKSEGNFSGGTSKEITVVSDADQKKLLAQVVSDLKGQAKVKLQEKYPDQKILEEALQEEIVKRSFSKNINDQASEFSLNLTINFKGTAFQDKDLKQLVSKLVSVNVPEGFELNLAETETLADVSKLEKDGKLIFLARFKAKLIPKVDTNEIKKQIIGKTPSQVEEILKTNQHILGTEIKLIPSMPAFLQRLPLLTQNIDIEVGLK